MNIIASDAAIIAAIPSTVHRMADDLSGAICGVPNTGMLLVSVTGETVTCINCGMISLKALLEAAPAYDPAAAIVRKDENGQVRA